MDLNLAIGHTYPRQAVDWNQRDLLLYALGVSEWLSTVQPVLLISCSF